jgi:hypothetical protein
MYLLSKCLSSFWDKEICSYYTLRREKKYLFLYVVSIKQANESTWKTTSNQSENGLLRKGEFTGRRWKVDDRSTESWIQGRSDGEVIF